MTTILNRELLTLFLAFLVVASVVSWVVANPPVNEDFASVSVLGPSMNAAVYFPNNVSTIAMNEQVQWYLQVFNHMGDTQLFSLYILLGNLTTTSPNATSNTPSGGTMVGQYYRAVQDDKTWTIPLLWSITNETALAGTTTIHGLTVNGNHVTTDISAIPSITNSLRFRIVIELWSYDVELHNFVFSIIANGVLDSVFDQIWFNANGM